MTLYSIKDADWINKFTYYPEMATLKVSEGRNDTFIKIRRRDWTNLVQYIRTINNMSTGLAPKKDIKLQLNPIDINKFDKECWSIIYQYKLKRMFLVQQRVHMGAEENEKRKPIRFKPPFFIQ